MARRNNKPNSKPEKDYEKDDQKPDSSRGRGKGKGSKQYGSNDIGWYSRYPAIYDAASNFIWSRPSGVTIPRNYKRLNGSNLLETGSGEVSVPGLMCFDVTHGIGNTHETGTNAPVNVATKAIYTWVRHLNSGHSNYDGPDLMLYLLAMNEAYAAISFIGRIYGTVAMYSGSNRYLPNGIAELMNVDLNSIKDNFANFRARMNILIQKASSLVVPLGLDIFKRSAFLYANYYTEGELTKDQIYFMNPTGFRLFDRDSSGAGYLKYYPISNWYSGGKLTWGSLCQILEDILTPLIADEDINIMSGDLLKAYGEGGIQRLVFLPEMFIAAPIKVEEVLWQLKNAKPIVGTKSNLDITQDGNHEYLIYEPTVTATADQVVVNTRDTMLVTDKVPTKEINMINSRLAATVDYGVDGATPNAGTIICGSEFVDNVRMYFHVNNNYYQNGLPFSFDYLTPGTVLGTLLMMSVFKYAPEITGWALNGGGVVELVPWNYYGVDDFTVLTRQDLTLVHDAAILSLFATPHVSM